MSIQGPSGEPEVSEAGASTELFIGGGGLALAMHQAGFWHLLPWRSRSVRVLLLRLNTARDFDPTLPDPRDAARQVAPDRG